MKTKTTFNLEFKWTTSRGRNTYGYNVCTLYVDGRKVARCSGGGYDMEGTCLGSWIEQEFADKLRALKPEDMPAQSHWEPQHPPVKCCRNIECTLAMLDDGKELEHYPEEMESCPHCRAELDYDRNAGKRVDDGRYFYGLRFYDPNYNPESAVLEHADDVFTKAEDIGKTFGQLRAEGKLVDLDVMRAAYKKTSPHATARHTAPHIDGGACGKSSVEQIARAIGLEFEYVPTRSKKSKAYVVRVAD